MINSSKEVWKPISNYSDYLISNYGRIRSLKRKSKGKILSNNLNKCGYYIINLFNKGKSRTKRIHRLVAEHFVPGQHPNLEVDHIDGNPLNNHYSNLQWITHKENVRKGKCSLVASATHSKTFLLEFPNGDIEVVKNLTRYARDNGITPDHLNRVARGIRKHHKGIKVTLLEDL